MNQIVYLPDEITAEARDADSILKTSKRQKIPHASACGGRARCSTCRIDVVEGLNFCSERNKREQRLADKLQFPDNIRLACQTKINGNIVLKRSVLDDVDMRLTNQLRRLGEADNYGVEKKVAILFSDISGYTRFAESMPAYDVVHVLNRYYLIMDSIITKYGGEISDIVGDGILALFGIDHEEEGPLKSIQAGLEMFQAVFKLNVYLSSMFNKTFGIRIGINYGTAVVGSFGSLHHKKVSAIGDAVNFASRIETANKEIGTHFLVSESMRQATMNHVNFGKTAEIEVKGKVGIHKLHQVLSLK